MRSGFYFVGPKGGKRRKIPLSAPPSLLLKSAPCVFELAPSVEERGRIKGRNFKRKKERIKKKEFQPKKKAQKKTGCFPPGFCHILDHSDQLKEIKK